MKKCLKVAILLCGLQKTYSNTIDIFITLKYISVQIFIIKGRIKIEDFCGKKKLFSYFQIKSNGKC